MTITAIRIQSPLPAGSPTVFELLGMNASLTAGAQAAMAAGSAEPVEGAIDLLRSFNDLPGSLLSKIVYLFTPHFMLRAGSGAGATRLFSVTANSCAPQAAGTAIPVQAGPALDFEAAANGMTGGAQAVHFHGRTGVALYSIVKVTGTPSGGGLNGASAIAFRSSNPDAGGGTRPEIIRHGVSVNGNFVMQARRSQDNSSGLQTISSGDPADGNFHRWLTMVDGTMSTGAVTGYKDGELIGQGNINLSGTVGVYDPTHVDVGAFQGNSFKFPGQFALGVLFNATLSEAERTALDALGASITDRLNL